MGMVIYVKISTKRNFIKRIGITEVWKNLIQAVDIT